RLKHVKENDLAHGEWERWCREDLRMTPQQANRFIKVVDELDDENRTTWFDLGTQSLYLIATLPPSERESEHMTAKGEQKKPEDMTVKELREVKRQLKAEKDAKEQA